MSRKRQSKHLSVLPRQTFYLFRSVGDLRSIKLGKKTSRNFLNPPRSFLEIRVCDWKDWLTMIIDRMINDKIFTELASCSQGRGVWKFWIKPEKSVRKCLVLYQWSVRCCEEMMLYIVVIVRAPLNVIPLPEGSHPLLWGASVRLSQHKTRGRQYNPAPGLLAPLAAW